MVDAGELARAVPMLGAGFGLATVAVLGLVVAYRSALRRVILGTVDPRPLGLVRIGFGLCLLLGALEVAPLNLYLYSDEGLMPSAAALQVYGRGGLAGYGDGVTAPAGFADARSLITYVTSGRWSALLFWDSPAFVRGYFAVFVILCLGMIVGWRTRACTVAVWVLYTGMLRRGDAHWGGEQVYCAFLFLLMLARAGEAFSVDNWIRCRRLRRRGLLSVPGGPGDGAGAPPGPDHPQGLAAIYRRVPAWPQLLIAAQLGVCYAANGWAKAGEMWVAGDAMTYVLHLYRHTRIDLHGLVVAVGAWPLRVATLAVLWWERLFPLVLLGLGLRAVAGRQGGWTRACWLALAGGLGLAALSGGLGDGGKQDASGGARAAVLGTSALAIVAAAVMRRPIRVGGVTLDRGWFARWPLGVWLWLGFGSLFHAINALTLNVGMFALATLATYPALLGDAGVRAVQRVTRGLWRLGVPVPEHMSRETAVAAEDPSLPHLRRGDAALPGWALGAAGGLVLVGAAAAISRGEVGWWHAAWLSAGTGLMIAGRRAARVEAERSRGSRSTDGAAQGEGAAGRVAWAYGPAGRVAAGGFAAYHLVSLLLWQLPKWSALPYQPAARKMVEPWLELSFTKQAWAMFSPNVPRTHASLRTTVVDADGAVHDLRTEFEHPENLVQPYLWHDRWRKIHEVVIGTRTWLAPWHARWLCRRWAFEHGAPPREVRLERVKAAIDPSAPGDPIAQFWAGARVEPVLAVACAEEPFAQLDDEVRARHGLARARPGELKYSPAKPGPTDPWAPLWWLLAGGLVGGVWTWARAERRARRGG